MRLSLILTYLFNHFRFKLNCVGSYLLGRFAVSGGIAPALVALAQPGAGCAAELIYKVLVPGRAGAAVP